MAQDYASVESILALDCGSTQVRALLMDRVDGEYRFVAQGAAQLVMAVEIRVIFISE